MIELKHEADVQIWCDYQEETRQTSANFFLRLRFSNFRTFITICSKDYVGNGYGYGDGYGYGFGDGNGCGYGDTFGNEWSNGDGWGCGLRDNYGDGYGAWGDGYGYGFGDGNRRNGDGRTL